MTVRPAPVTGEHKGRPIVHPETRPQLRRWLELNHATSKGVWLASWKKATGRPAVPYDAIVEEALCFGWIDSTVNTIDDERAANLYTPRKRGSVWSASNKRRVEALLSTDLMTPAGLAVIQQAKADGSWSRYDSVERMEEPAVLASALDAVPEARRQWDAFSPSARKAILWWVVSAKTDATRDQRVARVVADAAVGKKANYPG